MAKDSSPNQDIPKALTPAEVVSIYPYLTESTGVLANWRNLKRGPKYYVIGKRKIVYRPEDIEAFLFSNPVLTADSSEE